MTSNQLEILFNNFIFCIDFGPYIKCFYYTSNLIFPTHLNMPDLHVRFVIDFHFGFIRSWKNI